MSTVAFIVSRSGCQQNTVTLKAAHFILLLMVINSALAFKSNVRIYHSEQIAGELSLTSFFFLASAAVFVEGLQIVIRVIFYFVWVGEGWQASIDTPSILQPQCFPPCQGALVARSPVTLSDQESVNISDQDFTRSGTKPLKEFSSVSAGCSHTWRVRLTKV